MIAAVHPLDDVAAHAVDALDPPERAAVEAHVAACAGCRAELASHHEALAWVVEDEQPPPWLWDQVVADARAVRPPPPRSTRGPQHAAVGRLRPRTARRVVAGLAAAAAVVVGVAVGPTVLDALDDDGGPGVVAADLPVGTIEGEDGTTIARVAADEQGSYVEFEDAPELARDRDYQLWSVAGPAPVSLGVLGAGEGDVRISLPPDTSAVAISDEPAGGSPQPTGRVVGTGELAVPA